MENYSFSKSDRLLKNSDYKLLYKSGYKISNKYFTLIYCNGKGINTRFGITVSRHVGNAVTRNRIKRLIREFCRIHKNIAKGKLDIVIIAKKESAQLTSKEIFHYLNNIFQRLLKYFVYK